MLGALNPPQSHTSQQKLMLKVQMVPKEIFRCFYVVKHEHFLKRALYKAGTKKDAEIGLSCSSDFAKIKCNLCLSSSIKRTNLHNIVMQFTLSSAHRLSRCLQRTSCKPDSE